MAIFNASPVVGGISGNLGSVCFVNARGSKVLRPAKTKGASISLANQRKRSNFANATKEWLVLTEDQRNAWKTYANDNPVSNRLGEKSPLSGYQQFIKIRLFRFVTLNETIKIPPSPEQKIIITPLNVTWSLSAGLLLEIGEGARTGDVFVKLQAHLLYTESIPKFWGRFTNIGLLFAPQNTVQDITTFFTGTFPIPVVGQVVALNTRFVINNGTTSAESTQIIKVTA